MWQKLLGRVRTGEIKALARAITIVENMESGSDELLHALTCPDHSVIIGITGAPGSGKSTLTDSLIGEMVKKQKKVAVLCIDPSSPFNFGALLGDRIRMNNWYNHPSVFIRSIAARGSLGGLSSGILEITDLVRETRFDYIIIETVGIGQSEVEIAGLADVTVVVLVPEAGDEVQTMKAGMMEIADIFAVNKADRQGADLFLKNLKLMTAVSSNDSIKNIPVLKTVANANIGIEELFQTIVNQEMKNNNSHKKLWLLTEKAYSLIRQKRMKNIDKQDLLNKLNAFMAEGNLNIYQFIDTIAS